jgi:hypothetical protein
VEKCDETGNVYENKGSYLFKAGMSMKTGRLMFSIKNQPEPAFGSAAAAS